MRGSKLPQKLNKMEAYFLRWSARELVLVWANMSKSSLLWPGREEGGRLPLSEDTSGEGQWERRAEGGEEGERRVRGFWNKIQEQYIQALTRVLYSMQRLSREERELCGRAHFPLAARLLAFVTLGCFSNAKSAETREERCYNCGERVCKRMIVGQRK